MINTDKLRGLLAEKHVSQGEMADRIGIARKTFYEKMKRGVFGSDEIQIMIDTLDISDPMSIFFTRE